MNKQLTAELLIREGVISVHLNPRNPHVVVPPWLKHQDHLVLSVGENMPIPIPDLRVDKAGIFGTLDFSRTPYVCFIPWSAVFGIVGESGRGMVWEESAPPGVLRQDKAASEKLRSTKPTLRSVPNCGSPKGPPRRGHLSLVGSPKKRSGSGTYPSAR